MKPLFSPRAPPRPPAHPEAGPHRIHHEAGPSHWSHCQSEAGPSIHPEAGPSYPTTRRFTEAGGTFPEASPQAGLPLEPFPGSTSGPPRDGGKGGRLMKTLEPLASHGGGWRCGAKMVPIPGTEAFRLTTCREVEMRWWRQ